MKDFDNFQSWAEVEADYFSEFRLCPHFDNMNKLELSKNQVYNYSKVGMLHVDELLFMSLLTCFSVVR